MTEEIRSAVPPGIESEDFIGALYEWGYCDECGAFPVSRLKIWGEAVKLEKFPR